MAQRSAPQGIRTFLLIWFGQLISIIGSGLTSFALGVWAYETTGSATSFALILFFFAFPNVLFSVVAGPLVDRWDRRWVMILSDTGSALSTLALALLFVAGQLQVWHIYLAVAVNSALSAFQWPAYAAATTLLVPKEHYARANGLVQIGQAAGQIVSPVLAGFLVVKIGVQGVILTDFATFLFALLTLLLVRIPRPEPTAEAEAEKGSLWREFVYGWTYLVARPGLMGLLILFATLNFMLGFVGALITPMILAFTTAEVLGTVLSVGGSGMLFGGMLISIWGGPKRRMNGLFAFLLVTGLTFMVCGLRPSVPIITAGVFIFFFCFPIVAALSSAIWQSKVAPDVQGRVFALRNMVVMSSLPIAYAVAGPLADRVFEPLLALDGPLAETIGQVLGTGQGRGIGLMLVIMGGLTLLATAGGYLYPRLRLLEDELPDMIADEPAVVSEGPGGGGYQDLPDPVGCGAQVL